MILYWHRRSRNFKNIRFLFVIAAIVRLNSSVSKLREVNLHKPYHPNCPPTSINLLTGSASVVERLWTPTPTSTGWSVNPIPIIDSYNSSYMGEFADGQPLLQNEGSSFVVHISCYDCEPEHQRPLDGTLTLCLSELSTLPTWANSLTASVAGRA